VVPLQAMVQTVHTVGDEVHGKAGLAQALSEVVTRFGLIFNDQNFHVHILLTASLPVPERA
jgi:hypothetical protein